MLYAIHFVFHLSERTFYLRNFIVEKTRVRNKIKNETHLRLITVPRLSNWTTNVTSCRIRKIVAGNRERYVSIIWHCDIERYVRCSSEDFKKAYAARTNYNTKLPDNAKSDLSINIIAKHVSQPISVGKVRRSIPHTCTVAVAGPASS